MSNSEFKFENQNDNSKINNCLSLERCKNEENKRVRSVDNTILSKRPSILVLMDQKKSNANNINKNKISSVNETQIDKLINDASVNQSITSEPTCSQDNEQKLECKITTSQLIVDSVESNLKSIESNSGSEDSKVEQISTSESLNN